MANKLRASGQIQDKDRYIPISEAKKQMVAMLEDLKQEIIEQAYGIEILSVDVPDIDMVIQEKINALKEQ